MMTGWSAGLVARSAIDAPTSPPPPAGARVSVLGAGSWGTTFAKVMADAGCSVTLWGRDAELLNAVTVDHRNERYLPGVRLPDGVRGTTDIDDALDGAAGVAIALPAQIVGSELRRIAPSFPQGAIAVSLMKGIEASTFRRMSEVISDSLAIDPRQVAVVSGPNLAAEIAAEQPTATVVASNDDEIAKLVASWCASSYFRPYTNADPIGVELGGAVKNVIALAVGIAQGSGGGDNTKATIITRGLAEIARLGVVLGARAETFSGLAGLGDLVATCASALSRNHQLGVCIGSGMSLQDAVATIGRTAEGAASSRAVLDLARERGVEMPITRAVVDVLFEGLPVSSMAAMLLNRPHKAEGA